MKWFETNTQVRWNEVDGSGIVYYGNYFMYFDLAREYLANYAGVDYLTEVDILTLDTKARFYSPAFYADKLICRVALEHPKGAQYVFHYQILRDPGRKLLATGYTKHAVFNKEKQRIEYSAIEGAREQFESIGAFFD